MNENTSAKEHTNVSSTAGRTCYKLQGTIGLARRQYKVIKSHHRHGWLRQERMLEITCTHVRNCKPAESTGASPEITKQFLLTDITSIGFKGKKTFCLHIRGDHVYYYSSPWAIEIAFDIQRFVAAANAVSMLLEPGDRLRAQLMEQLITRAIPLPGVESRSAARYAAYSPRAARLRSNIMTALRNDKIDGSYELRELKRLWREKAVVDAKDIKKLRRAISGIRDLCAADVIRCSTLPHYDEVDMYAIVVISIESVLQRDVIRENFDKIIQSLRQDKVLAERQNLFDQQRMKLREHSAKYFDIPEWLRKLPYDLVLHHFEILSTCKCPCDILAQLVNIAACLCLTVYVVTCTRKQSKSSPKQNANQTAQVSIPTIFNVTSVEEVAADGVGPVSVHESPNETTREKTDMKNGKQMIKNDKIDEGHNSVPSSFTDGSLSTGKGASGALRNSDASIALSYSPTPPASSRSAPPFPCKSGDNDNLLMATATENSTGDLLVLSSPPLRVPVSESNTPSLERERELWLKDMNKNDLCGKCKQEIDEEDLSVSKFSSFSSDLNPTILGRQKKCTLSADEIAPLFIHLLCQSNVPDVCLILHAVNLLHDTDGSSEADYYLTTFIAAVEMICSSDPPLSTALPKKK